MNNKKFNKRGQLAVFIIVAILIVIAIILVFFAINTSKNQLNQSIWSRLGIKSDVDLIKSTVSDCMNVKTTEALRKIGLQGGFYNKPAKAYDLDWAFVPYYYYQGQILMPNKSVVESELSNYVDNNLKTCINEVDFKNYQIDFSDSKTKTSISKSKVVFTIDMPISLKKEDKITLIDLKRFPVVYNSSLNEILEIAQYITDSHRENPDMICINCVVNMAKERKVYVDMMAFPYDPRTTLVMISENRTMPEPYLFEFLNKYG